MWKVYTPFPDMPKKILILGSHSSGMKLFRGRDAKIPGVSAAQLQIGYQQNGNELLLLSFWVFDVVKETERIRVLTCHHWSPLCKQDYFPSTCF